MDFSLNLFLASVLIATPAAYLAWRQWRAGTRWPAALATVHAVLQAGYTLLHPGPGEPDADLALATFSTVLLVDLTVLNLLRVLVGLALGSGVGQDRAARPPR